MTRLTPVNAGYVVPQGDRPACSRQECPRASIVLFTITFPGETRERRYAGCADHAEDLIKWLGTKAGASPMDIAHTVDKHDEWLQRARMEGLV